MKIPIAFFFTIGVLSTPALGQGLVNFFNNSTTLVSAEGTAIQGPRESYYFGLLIAPVGTTDPRFFTFSGAYGTNQLTAGRFSGGGNVAIANWPAGQTRAFMVAGWSAALGHDWNPEWLIRYPYGPGFLGFSTIGEGVAGGFDGYGSLPSLNIFGVRTINSGFALYVLFPPPRLIVISPYAQSVVAGATAVFSAFCSTCSTYQWQFDGIDIAGATNSTLTLPNVGPSQEGVYGVRGRVEPGGQTAYANATLTVLSVPAIVRSPASQVVSAGASCNFSVAATGAPPLAYQWYFNGLALAGATTTNLSFSSAQIANSGSYTVEVTNSFGAVTSSPEVLTVVAHKPAILSQPAGQTVVVGDDWRFGVAATGSLPLAYQWFCNGLAVNGAGGQLLLTNIQFSQSGGYNVVITNAFGSVTSAIAVLNVLPRPTYSVLHNFDGGGLPCPRLSLSDGMLYGAKMYGGSSGGGAVFKVSTNGSGFSVLKQFSADSDEAAPWGGVIVSGGKLYGTTWGGGTPTTCGAVFTVFTLNTDGSGYSLLHRFSGHDGRAPMGSLLFCDAMVFGTTYEGGDFGFGTVFRIGTNGSAFSVLKHFNGSDGAYPHAGMLSLGGTVFGTASARGPAGGGVLFRMNLDGSAYTILKTFSGVEGSWPSDNLVLSDTTLYGTTRYGGVDGSGTIFSVDTDGTDFRTLKQFRTNDPGVDPWGGMVLSGGTLYGTLFGGGVATYGAIFKIDTDGSDYAVLKQFNGAEEGAFPYGLVASGTCLYGVAQRGGSSDCGVVFALSLPIPRVITPPCSQTAEAGADVFFTAGAARDPAQTYQWFFNATNVVSGTSTNAHLQLTDVQFSQAGAYTVVLSNAFGVITSAPAMLSVIPVVPRRMVPGLLLTAEPASLLNIDYTPQLDPPDWQAFPTVYLTNSPQFYFDLSSPLPAERFYRVWQTGAPSVVPSVSLPGMVPAISLTGSVGSSIRIDCINPFGPTDAWVPLVTVPLTSSPQLYFDTSAIGQPPRLYRLIP